MGRSSSRHALLLGATLLATLGLGFVWFGGARAPTRAVLHLLVALGLTLALLLPDRALARAAWLPRAAAAGGLILGVVSVALLPAPALLRGIVAPGTVAAFPERAWSTLGLDPEATVGELTFWVLVVGGALAAAAWASARDRRQPVERATLILLGGVAAVALGHLLTDATALFGALEPATAAPRFFAPFVNPNHLASLLLLGLPVLVGEVVDRPPLRDLQGLAALVLLVAAGALLLASGSVGALAAGGAVLLLVLLQRIGLRGTAFVAAQVALFGAAALIWTRSYASGLSRLGLWRDAARAAPDFWLVGVGGGAFGGAIEPYRTDRTHFTFAHAHSEPVEWLVEGGLVGLLALVPIIWLLWPGRLRGGRRGDRWALGFVGLALHSLVEFPLQLPGIALAAAMALACRATVYAEAGEAPAGRVRGALLAFALLQLPAAGWQVRTGLADRAAAHVGPEGALEAQRALSWSGPWRPERLFIEAELHPERAGEIGAVVVAGYPNEPATLLRAAGLLHGAGRPEEALAATVRASERRPSDYRAWVALARLHRASGRDELAVAAWVEAFRREAPGRFIAEAYASLPVGLYWLEATGDSSGYVSAELGNVLMREEGLEMALLAYEQAARQAPATFGRDPRLASCLYKLGRKEEAERLLGEARMERPDDVGPRRVLGDLLTADGRHAEASIVFLDAAELDERYFVQALRSAELADGADEAIRLYRRLRLSGRGDPALVVEASRILRDAGDEAGCRREIDDNHVLVDTKQRIAARAVYDSCGQPRPR